MKRLGYLYRKYNKIEVTGLDLVHSVQRMVYGLLKKNACVPKDDDHKIFKRLSEHSQGETTTIHMLTSLMQKNKDSRENFDCISQQLQSYVLFGKLSQNIASNCEDQRILPPHKDICTYNNYILECNLSQPACHLLNCLCITGPIPFLRLYVEELSHCVTVDLANKGQRCTMLVEEIEKVGVIRKCPNSMIYHKFLDPNSSFHDQLIVIPKQICNAVRNKMNDKSKIEKLHLIKDALNNVTTHKLNSKHLPYILVLCRELWDFCEKKQQPELANTFCKLMEWVVDMIKIFK